ncbi:hypothetical protein SCHPADRAFT_940698 [Schizopora paradoxa]|uniref:Uncharacterized protein n=1 Tax=Schizopora paradoxa TaxID=27342 RepID=A0A0H2RN58_9AGAM|nr:hypothetical protein SCHPADRAFT_940698 [Schizopora paradoxa]
MERAKGIDSNNVVTVTMRVHGNGVYDEPQPIPQLPAFGNGIDEDTIQKYIFSISQCVVAEHEEVKKTLAVNVEHHGDDADAHPID